MSIHAKVPSIKTMFAHHHHRLALSVKPRPHSTTFQKIVTHASIGSGPAYNKYKTRRQLEEEYYKEWEKTTILSQEEVDRPMTFFTFMAILPTWFKFYGLPGPLRYLRYLIGMKIHSIMYSIHKKFVLEGAKFDRSLILKNKNLTLAILPMSLILYRLHYRVSIIENLKYRWSILQGKEYSPKILPLKPRFDGF